MNETIQLLNNHHSDRSFTDEPITDADLDAIVEAAHRAPTSRNSQQVSLVVVRDAVQRARIAEIAGGQPWIAKAPVFIAVVVDFYKTAQAARKAGVTQVLHESVEGLVTGVTDAGIALGTLITAAHALGLGLVPLGSIRRDPVALVKVLGLPPLTFPVVGLSIGHIDRPAFSKPRLPIETFRHDERYDVDALSTVIDAYDAALLDYWTRIGRTDGTTWSGNTAQGYKSVYFPGVRKALADQGLTLEK